MKIRASNLKFNPINLRPKKAVVIPGARPGDMIIPSDAIPSKIKTYSYNNEDLEVVKFENLSDTQKHINENPNKFHWIEIKGLASIQVIGDLVKIFGLSKLTIEDILSQSQRPKLEYFDDHLVIISRMMYQNSSDHITNEQFNIIQFKNFLITIESNYEDSLEPLRKRLNLPNTNIREKGIPYLAYAICDVVLDNFFPLIEKLGLKMDELEERLLISYKSEILFEIQQIKSNLIHMRRAVWPEREKLREMLMSDNLFTPKELRSFYQDIYDHSIQLMDMVESNKEMAGSLMEVYMSSVSHKTNEVMKVLTIISSIFIPLTFIAGIYGMNFSPTNPYTNEPYPYNLPELYLPYGYPVVLSLMALVAIILFFIFKRRNWL
ncbi:MAG: magnesium transporter [Sphingobacteriales bacterium]|jgi:magnesium transporter